LNSRLIEPLGVGGDASLVMETVTTSTACALGVIPDAWVCRMASGVSAAQNSSQLCVTILAHVTYHL
jgi:hypothetical protein